MNPDQLTILHPMNDAQPPIGTKTDAEYRARFRYEKSPTDADSQKGKD
jgi:hypothetical protein